MKWLLRSIVAVLAFGVGVAHAELMDTIQAIKPSIVAVGLYKATNSPPYSMRGTGFVVGKGNRVVTNAHVVAPTGETDGNTLMVQVASLGTGSQLRQARVVTVDREHDLALLQVDGPPLPSLGLGDSEKVREGQVIAFTGFPIGAVLGFSPVSHRGSVSAITPIALPLPNSRSLNETVIRRLKSGSFAIFQLDATAYPGNSGSPVYDPDSGEVFGVINMVFVKGSKEAVLSTPSGIAYAIPSRYVKELLEK